MIAKEDISIQSVKALLETVMDPEVPVLSVIDLGIVRDIILDNDDIEVIITPTYSGCPAMDVISMMIRMTLLEYGFKDVKVSTTLFPAWTTEWMSEAGKQKLKAYGIAAPNPMQQVCHLELFAPNEAVQCPRCDSYHTTRISEFGSTACKALYSCDDCKEPFDYFKSH